MSTRNSAFICLGLALCLLLSACATKGAKTVEIQTEPPTYSEP